jgi:hypothetical protein
MSFYIMKNILVLIALTVLFIGAAHSQQRIHYFTEHFNDTLQHWPIVDSSYGSTYLSDGEYYIKSGIPGIYAAFPDVELKRNTNFKLSYIATWHEGVENFSYGITWGEKTGPHANVFQVNHGKWVDVWEAGDKEQKRILNTAFCSGMHTSMFNRFTIECIHRHVKIWINDDLVFTGKLKQYPGFICFHVYNKQTVSYDDVRLEYWP